MSIGFKSLGTDISIEIIADDINGNLEKDTRGFYLEKEKIFSRFSKDSELGKLNSHLGEYMSASSDIIEIARKSLLYYQESHGYFDPRIIDILENIGYDRNFKDIDLKDKKTITAVPLGNNLEDDLKIDGDKIFFGCRMDFSGIAKGYITDQAVKYLKNKGYGNVLVDSGGDIRVSGRNGRKENWAISLEGFPEEKMLIGLNDDLSSVATSGITRRKWENENGKFHHLINPKNPQEFSFDLKSVTVVAKTCEEADVWAKVLFLIGKEDGLKFSEEKGMRSLFLDYKGNVYLSSEMKKDIYK